MIWFVINVWFDSSSFLSSSLLSFLSPYFLSFLSSSSSSFLSFFPLFLPFFPLFLSFHRNWIKSGFNWRNRGIKSPSVQFVIVESALPQEDSSVYSVGSYQCHQISWSVNPSLIKMEPFDMDEGPEIRVPDKILFCNILAVIILLICLIPVYNKLDIDFISS